MKVKNDHRSKFSSLSSKCAFIYSSVGRASHRFSRRSRVRIPLKLWFFQASSFQKLENLMRWSFFTFVVVVVVVCCRCCCIVSGCFIENKWQALTLPVCLTAVVRPGARPKQRKPIEVSGKTQDRNSGNKRKKKIHPLIKYPEYDLT